MYNNNKNTYCPQQEGIDIPYHNSNANFRQNVFYGDPLSAYYNNSIGSTDYEQHNQFSTNSIMVPPLQQQQSMMIDDDPMTDHNFMAFLSLLSTSELVIPSLSCSSSPSSLLLFQQHHSPPIISGTSANSLISNSSNSSSDTNKKKQMRHLNKKTTSTTSSTRIGQCEHPKHVIYRQERYTLATNTTADETSLLKTIPRRGRPPKGSKSTEFFLSTSPVIIPGSLPSQPHYPIVELTIRPLPKRLEAVVGRANIKVCLTCLKRSDTDQEYLANKLYIGPQQMYKKKQQQ